jgi:hypothetical protein
MSDPASRARQLMQEKENIEAEIVSPKKLLESRVTADEASINTQDAYRSQLEQVSISSL